MKIIVLVKAVPDTYADRLLRLDTGLADRAASDEVLDEIGERAIEVGLSYADSTPETEVVLLSMGPASAAAVIKKGLAMGATSAVHVVDDLLAGADLGVTAEVLAAAIDHIGFDLVIAGNQSTDGMGGVLPAMVAERLGVPHVTALSTLDITNDGVRGERIDDDAELHLEASLPAVASITERFPSGRFPSFKGIMAAKKKPYVILALSDLAGQVNETDVARSIVVGITRRPPRGAGIKVNDDGQGGLAVAQFLVDNRLV